MQFIGNNHHQLCSNLVSSVPSAHKHPCSPMCCNSEYPTLHLSARGQSSSQTPSSAVLISQAVCGNSSRFYPPVFSRHMISSLSVAVVEMSWRRESPPPPVTGYKTGVLGGGGEIVCFLLTLGTLRKRMRVLLKCCKVNHWQVKTQSH